MNIRNIYNKGRRELFKVLSRTCMRHAQTDYFGLQVSIPLLHGVGAEFLVARDPWMSFCLELFLQNKPGLVVDIGANTGLYLLKLRAIDQQREYLGFEPNPIGNHYMQELIRQNSFQNTRVLPFALSDQKTMRQFYIARKADKMGSLYDSARFGDERKKFSFDVLTLPGDEIFDTLDPQAISAIKIDVEGAELEVLRGIRKTVSRHKPFIYCEIWRVPEPSHPTYQEKLQNLEALLELIAELDYCILGATGAQPDNVDELQSIDDFSGYMSRDYVLVHRDDLELIKSALARHSQPMRYKP